VARTVPILEPCSTVIRSVCTDELAAVAGTGAITNVSPKMAGARTATSSLLPSRGARLDIGGILSSANSHTAVVGGEIAFQARFLPVRGTFVQCECQLRRVEGEGNQDAGGAWRMVETFKNRSTP
jgi:hypothetical protein